MNNKNETVYKVEEKSELLSFLFEKIENKSKNNIKTYLSNGQVLVNNKIMTKHDYIVFPNDNVSVRLNYIKYDNNIDIVYEDNDFVVVDKPSNLLTISDNKGHVNLYSLVSNYVKRKNKNNKIFIVHRLDKDTSGLVLFAKNKEVKEYLQKYWNDKVDRFYFALVHNSPKDDVGTLISYLKEDNNHYVYSSSDGEYASTYYEVINKKKSTTLLGLKLNTGKKNQIRVQLKDINCPIVGDKKYGIKDNNKEMCLYAYKISFIYKGKKYKFETKECKFYN